MTKQTFNVNNLRTVIILPGYIRRRVEYISGILNNMQYQVKCFNTLKETTLFCYEQFASICCIISAMNIGTEEFIFAGQDAVGGLHTGFLWLLKEIEPIVAKQTCNKTPKILTLKDSEDTPCIVRFMKDRTEEQKKFFEKHNHYILYSETTIERELRKHLGG
jgi:hypothetical protein